MTDKPEQFGIKDSERSPRGYSEGRGLRSKGFRPIF